MKLIEIIDDRVLLDALTRRLVMVCATRPEQGSHHEPEFYWLADPPGSAVVQAYVQRNPPQETEQGRVVPVFYAALPLPPADRLSLYLVKGDYSIPGASSEFAPGIE